MPLIPFARQTVDAEYNGERLVNWFLRASEGAVSPAVLVSSSGLTAASDALNGPVRAMVEMGGALYACAGGFVWKFDGTTTTNVGTVPDSTQISMAASGTEVAICSVGDYYICDGTTTTNYSTGAITEPQWVVFISGYFVVSGTIGTRDDALTVSGLDDGTTFSSTDFAFAENAPDAIRGLIVDHNRLWVFGARTTELFWNSGNADFPFEPSLSEFVERGCFDGLTVAKEDNAVYMIGEDRIVYRMQGTPQVVSTREVEEALEGATILGAFTYEDRGHKFYAIRRAGDTTLCLDITSGLWPERSTGVDDGPWMATCQANLNGVQYFWTTEGYIATASKTVHTDLGTTCKREAVSLPLMDDGSFVNVSRVEIRVSTTTTGIGRTPQIVMQTSRDGKTWGLEKWRDLPDVGEYNKRIAWHGLGAFRRAQVRFRVTDPVACDLFGIAYARG